MPEDILVLMTDQHRADWVGAFGGSHVRTPTLDGLAEDGVRFTRCITSCPLCMPARASFLTGMYPHNFGMWDNNGRLQNTGDSILHSLRSSGYRTCHVGKSHLYPHGGGRDLRAEEPYMRALGWDDILECTGPLSTQTTKSILTDWMEREGIYSLFLEDYARRRGNLGLWPSPLPDGKHADDFIANTAVDYIERSDASQPLYLFVGLGGPHNPWDSPKRFDTYDPESMPAPLPVDEPPEWLAGPALEYHRALMGSNPATTPEEWARLRSLYSGRVEHVDSLMGRVLEAWQAARGRDTWVLFWTDHGEMAGDKRRIAKSVFFDPVVRVPVILRPPARSAGSACDALVGTTDLSATLLDIAGHMAPSNVFGRSLLPALSGGDVGAAVAVSQVHSLTMVCDRRWKMVLRADNSVLALYDTVEDPHETLNLAGRPGATDTVDCLRSQLLSFLLRAADSQYGEVNG